MSAMYDSPSSANGTNGYLADGTRVQVPDGYRHRHSVWLVRDFEELPLDLRDIGSTMLSFTEHQLRRLHWLIPPGVLGPVEGDGSWLDDDLTGGRIVTLWVEQGGAMWDRLHRSRDPVARSTSGSTALSPPR